MRRQQWAPFNELSCGVFRSDHTAATSWLSSQRPSSHHWPASCFRCPFIVSASCSCAPPVAAAARRASACAPLEEPPRVLAARAHLLLSLYVKERAELVGEQQSAREFILQTFNSASPVVKGKRLRNKRRRRQQQANRRFNYNSKWLQVPGAQVFVCLCICKCLTSQRVFLFARYTRRLGILSCRDSSIDRAARHKVRLRKVGESE